MVNTKSTSDCNQHRELQHNVLPLLKNAPWVLRVTEYKDKPSPVLVVKERLSPEENLRITSKGTSKTTLKERGLLYGQPLRRCLPILRAITSSITNDAGIPLEIQRVFGNGRLTFRGNLPLDEEAGVKLSLIFKLQERVKEMDRVELIAWRVERFSREEAAYWLSRVTQYGEAANRWAQAGMRIMLGGQPGDQAIPQMLDRLRE
ncbi:MAG: DUF7680 family protein [Bacillota bacterium]